MENRIYLEACKLINVRMIECSCRLINPDVQKSKIEMSLKHEVNFSLSEEDDDEDFFLDFHSEIKTVDEDKNDFFEINAKFRATYIVFDKEKTPPEQFADISELLGHQLYPVIRSFFADTLLKMGLPPFVPWSMQQAPEKKVAAKPAKKTVRKTKKTSES